MLDGWYCRTMANQNSTEQNEQDDENEPNVVDDSDESQDISVAHMMPRVDYKAQYNTLKKKLKFLLYVSKSVPNLACLLRNCNYFLLNSDTSQNVAKFLNTGSFYYENNI